MVEKGTMDLTVVTGEALHVHFEQAIYRVYPHKFCVQNDAYAFGNWTHKSLDFFKMGTLESQNLFLMCLCSQLIGEERVFPQPMSSSKIFSQGVCGKVSTK